MNAGLENIIRDVQGTVEIRIRSNFDKLPPSITSPIEKYFAVALTEACLFMVGVSPKFKVLHWGKGTPFEPVRPLRQWEIQVWAQERILDWPADFVIATLGPDDKERIAVVECDGHAFHERTKEQAQRDRSRDRAVQGRGWRMIRYTGSELYKDACTRVMEDTLLGWACQFWDKPQ